MKSNLLLILVLVFVSTISCKESDSDLESALEQAGKNRPELEKVLSHYAGNTSDSLKLKAAKFLIGNMPGHISYSYPGVDSLYALEDSIYSLEIDANEKMVMMDSIMESYLWLEKETVEDNSIITAEYLIHNIDDAFGRWNLNYFNKGLSFEDFCEYLLPYKTVELQAFDYWRDTLRKRFPTIFSDDKPYNGEYRRFSHYGATVVNNALREHLTPRPLNQGYSHPRLLNARSMCKMPYGLCDDFSIILVSLLRSCGIPAALCYVPMWSDQNNGHTFVSVLCNGKKELPMIWGYESNPGDAFPPAQICAKIFRYTYAPDERSEYFRRHSSYLYPGFTVFRKDVTSEYISTCDINVKVTGGKRYGRYAYIATYNAGNWIVQDFGDLKGDNAYFKNMGKEIAYMVFGYDGGEIKPISSPFLLHWDGNIEYMVPNVDSLRTVNIARKFPKKDLTEELENRVIGGKIQASNRKDFKECKTFYTIDTLAGSLVKNIECDKAYRYWRFLSPEEGWCNFFELQFFERCDTSLTPLKGKIIGTLDAYMDDPYWHYERAFDGDWLTGFHYKDKTGGWIGLDLGKPMFVDSFLCVPRSDDNGIHLNDLYELLYWYNDGWQSLGCKYGKDWTLQYDGVPDSSLLLLKNHTRGKQERPFVLRDGRQEWW